MLSEGVSVGGTAGMHPLETKRPLWVVFYFSLSSVCSSQLAIPTLSIISCIFSLRRQNEISALGLFVCKIFPGQLLPFSYQPSCKDLIFFLMETQSHLSVYYLCVHIYRSVQKNYPEPTYLFSA